MRIGSALAKVELCQPCALARRAQIERHFAGPPHLLPRRDIDQYAAQLLDTFAVVWAQRQLQLLGSYAHTAKLKIVGRERIEVQPFVATGKWRCALYFQIDEHLVTAVARGIIEFYICRQRRWNLLLVARKERAVLRLPFTYGDI